MKLSGRFCRLAPKLQSFHFLQSCFNGYYCPPFVFRLWSLKKLTWMLVCMGTGPLRMLKHVSISSFRKKRHKRTTSTHKWGLTTTGWFFFFFCSSHNVSVDGSVMVRSVSSLHFYSSIGLPFNASVEIYHLLSCALHYCAALRSISQPLQGICSYWVYTFLWVSCSPLNCRRPIIGMAHPYE